LSGYLKQHPGSGHAKDVERMRHDRFETGLSTLKTSCAQDSAGCAALLKALDALKDEESPKLSMTLESTVDGSGMDADSLRDALKESNAAAEKLLATRFEQTLHTAGMTLVQVVPRGAAPVTLALSRRETLEGTVSATGVAPAPRVVTQWSAALKGAGAETPVSLTPHPQHSFKVAAANAHNGWALAVMNAQVDQDVDAFSDELADGLGLRETAVMARLSLSPSPNQHSPY